MDESNAEQTPNTERFWLKKHRAKEKRVNTMSGIKRLQYSIHAWTGELVTSTRMETDTGLDEYFTTASLAFLIGAEERDIWSIMNSHGLIMIEKHNQRWATAKDSFMVMGLLAHLF